MCLCLPETTERISHGEPTFFAGKKVFVMFSNNHHGDGRIAVWLPVPPGMQKVLVDAKPVTFFVPPYVGVRGWIGIELGQIDDDELVVHVEKAWDLVATNRMRRDRDRAES